MTPSVNRGPSVDKENDHNEVRRENPAGYRTYKK